MKNLALTCKKTQQKEKWGATCGISRGYYLCVRIDGTERKYWFGEQFSVAKANFDRACNQWLTEKNGWRYTIEYSHGLLVNGTVGWGNMNLADDFLD